MSLAQNNLQNTMQDTQYFNVIFNIKNLLWYLLEKENNKNKKQWIFKQKYYKLVANPIKL